MKSTVEQIRQRFDNEVERFSNLETGQSATIDAPLSLDLISSAAVAVTPNAKDLLDIGCGAGNYTLKLIEKFETDRGLSAGSGANIEMNCLLVDLSQAMLDRAAQRVSSRTKGKVSTLQSDMRDAHFGEQTVDVVVAGATLHHLRTDVEWEAVFAKIFRALRPGGCFWICDLVEHTSPSIQSLFQQRYGDYLRALKGGGETGRKYRDEVFAYVAAEDTPKPLVYQLNLLQRVGFTDIEVLHKNVLFAAFGGSKP